MEMETTPPFLAWALEQACPLRNIDRWQEPERTERHLRAVVEYGRGVREDRIVADVCLGPECLDPSTPVSACTGFKIEDALSMFGGKSGVLLACSGCPANVRSESRFAPGLTGCHALLPLPQLADWTSEARCAWYSLCARSPWQRTSVENLQVFSLVFGQAFPTDRQSEEFHFAAALNCCLEQSIPLHVRMFPAGRIEGRRWILPEMCMACGAQWQGLAACAWCGSATSSGGEKKRHVRGRRPFLPLLRFVPEAEATRLVEQVREAKDLQKRIAREIYQRSLQTPAN